MLLGFGVSDDYDVLLDGKLVIVDGIHFYVRNGVVFVDCFLCPKSTTLSMMTSHVIERHDVESVVQCRAKNCRKNLSPAAIQVGFNRDVLGHMELTTRVLPPFNEVLSYFYA